MTKPTEIESIVSSALCSGCGACVYMAPDALDMADVPDDGRRPQLRADAVVRDGLREAAAVCPGIGLTHDYDRSSDGLIRELEAAWGPVYAVYEGHAADPAIRYAGSSGGAASAIALYCLEVGGMHGVLHTAAQAEIPYLNETVMSHTRDELLGRTGSRYAPASPCDGLQRVVDAPSPCVFIGKPCDVAATRKARRLRPELDAKLGVTIGFYCAGTPSTQGTLAMLARMGISDPASLISVRYRGNGWPGRATAVFRENGGEASRDISYEESWGEVLANHQQWRCKVCADHTGEFADIAVGDPWYKEISPDNPGSSMILARTKHGGQIIEAAIAAGYLVAEPVRPSILPDSQRNLLRTRGAIWGRILASRLMGARAPKYRRMPMFRHWWRELSTMDKVRSVAGTIRRILKRRRQAR